ncbi:MAG: hypothetical protein V3T21_00740 [Candidatus Margulisiibacteriota bacterium]
MALKRNYIIALILGALILLIAFVLMTCGRVREEITPAGLRAMQAQQEIQLLWEKQLETGYLKSLAYHHSGLLVGGLKSLPEGGRAATWKLLKHETGGVLWQWADELGDEIAAIALAKEELNLAYLVRNVGTPIIEGEPGGQPEQAVKAVYLKAIERISGKEKWDIPLSYENFNYTGGKAVLVDASSGLVCVAGQSLSRQIGEQEILSDGVVTVHKSNGDLDRFKHFSTDGDDSVVALALASGEKFWALGMLDKGGAAERSFITKLDLQLNTWHHKEFDGDLRALKKIGEHLYLAGEKAGKAVLLKYNPASETVVWEKIFPEADSLATAVIALDDERICVTGYRMVGRIPEAFMIILDSDGLNPLADWRMGNAMFYAAGKGSFYGVGQKEGHGYIAKLQTVPAGGVTLPLLVGNNVVADFTSHGIDVKVTIERVEQEGTILGLPQEESELPGNARELRDEQGLKVVSVGEKYVRLLHTGQIAGAVEIEMPFDPALLPTQDYWKIVGGWLWDEEFVLWEPMPPVGPVDPLKVIARMSSDRFPAGEFRHIVPAVIEYPKMAIEKIMSEIDSQYAAFNLTQQEALAVNRMLGQALQILGRIASPSGKAAKGAANLIWGARKRCVARKAQGILTGQLMAIYHAIKIAHHLPL